MEHSVSGLSDDVFNEPDSAHLNGGTEGGLITDVPPVGSIDALVEPTSAMVTDKGCCICSSGVVKYTCPECDRRSCSLNCVNEHKNHYSCTGIPSLARHVDLNNYTSRQMQRDYHFLEDCRRIIDNAARSLGIPNVPRYKFHALPSNLRVLREEARKRGVICQIMSEGMRKRDENTSRYDRCNNTITWRCEFIFYPSRVVEANEMLQNDRESFTVSTNWASERHKLGDVLQYCWAINPPLPCFHINQKYNKVSGYVARSNADTPLGLAQATSAGLCDTVHGPSCPSSTTTKSPLDEGLLPDSLANASEDPGSIDEKKPVEIESRMPRTPLDASRLLEQHLGSRVKVEKFLSAGPWAILAKAERLGNKEKYFRLNSNDTLNEVLRVLFFVNEYPVFIVVYEADLPCYPLISDEDKEAIRESFHVTDKQRASAVDGAGGTAGRHLAKPNRARDRQSWRQGAPQYREEEGLHKDFGSCRESLHEYAGQNHKRFREDSKRPRPTRPFCQRKANQS